MSGGGAGGRVPFLRTGGCHDGSIAVSVHGEIDMATAPQLDDALARAQAAAPHVVVDLQDVPFMDSSGVRVLLLAHERAAASGRRLVVLNGSGPAHRTLEATGVDAVLLMADARDELPAADADAVDDAAL